MLATRRTITHPERRAMGVRRRRRVYVGGAVIRRATSAVFLSRSTQHVAARTALGDWLGAAFTLIGIAGWGTLLMLLGA